MVKHSEASVVKLKEELSSKLKQVRATTNLKADFEEASKICQELYENKERVELELEELRDRQLSDHGKQLQSTTQRVEQLERENFELKQQLGFRCPVCLLNQNNQLRFIEGKVCYNPNLI
ncbi:unnamed protein product [Brachionus calyciflorus]|uniref:Uncharacterized protein n=1 Tax=Brachionus calyciflorus TaxID=104777 RepID=A0A814LV78_9BILA|nr:unnamed protein product [Brachionus calyciflorus]